MSFKQKSLSEELSYEEGEYEKEMEK